MNIYLVEREDWDHGGTNAVVITAECKEDLLYKYHPRFELFSDEAKRELFPDGFSWDKYNEVRERILEMTPEVAPEDMLVTINGYTFGRSLDEFAIWMMGYSYYPDPKYRSELPSWARSEYNVKVRLLGVADEDIAKKGPFYEILESAHGD